MSHKPNFTTPEQEDSFDRAWGEPYKKMPHNPVKVPVDAIQSVIAERKHQDAKWGEQNHDPTVWMCILGEEFGELCQAVNETWFDNGPLEKMKGGYANMRAEAVQVAAVAISLIECLDRRHKGVVE